MMSDKEFARTLRLRRIAGTTLTALAGYGLMALSMWIAVSHMGVPFWRAFIVIAIVLSGPIVATLEHVDRFIVRASLLMDEADRQHHARRAAASTYRP